MSALVVNGSGKRRRVTGQAGFRVASSGARWLLTDAAGVPSHCRPYPDLSPANWCEGENAPRAALARERSLAHH